MLDIIGNIKVDESRPERVDYFLACLRSWEFFSKKCNIILHLESPSERLVKSVKEVFDKCHFNGHITYSSNPVGDYGTVYMNLLKMSSNPYILNFIEDHFTVIDDEKYVEEFLEFMGNEKIDVCLTSFHTIESYSSTTLKNATSSRFGTHAIKDTQNFVEYCRHYGSRYYLGVNFLTTRSFAEKFWNRSLGSRPHDYEIPSYSKEWEHTFMVPSMEIQCAVDDDHGEEGTCVVKREIDKWKVCYRPSNDKQEYPAENIAFGIGSSLLQQNQHAIIKDIPFMFTDLQAENDSYQLEIDKRWDKIKDSGVYLFGDQHKELEERFAKLIGRKYCVLVKNGTDALTMAIQHALETCKADIILPNFGAYPTAVAALRLSPKLHFVDVDESLTIDVKKLPDVRNGIIIPVHLFGNNCNMKAITRYAIAHNHRIIEDCAQSCGSGSGQAGDYAIFSFYPTKPLGTMGDGGAILTDSKEAYEFFTRMRFYGNHQGIIQDPGINSRMGELECAVVNAKLDTFEHMIEERRAIASRYKKIVQGMRINSNCIYHQFPVLFNEREKILEGLKKAGIPYMIHYPMHVSDQPAFEFLEHKPQFVVSDKIVSLPCHAFMEESHIRRVEDFLSEYKEYEY